MSEMINHAERELSAYYLGDYDSLKVANRKYTALLDFVKAFAMEGHSGGGASIVGPSDAEVLRRVLAFEPVLPLTGEDDEWNEITEEMAGRPGLYQNNRCGRVFREGGVAHDVEAVIFKDRHGFMYQCHESRRKITFPYQPKTRITRWRRLSTLIAKMRGDLA